MPPFSDPHSIGIRFSTSSFLVVLVVLAAVAPSPRVVSTDKTAEIVVGTTKPDDGVDDNDSVSNGACSWSPQPAKSQHSLSPEFDLPTYWKPISV